MMPFCLSAQDMVSGDAASEVYESDVAFIATVTDAKHLTDAQKQALLLKVEKIIAKNNAGVTSEHNAFAIKADIEIKDTKTSAGLVRNVTVLTAEVALTAYNVQDGSIYYSNSIEIETDVVGDSRKAMDQLISSIKVTDPQFVRFVRTSRKRIAEWYNTRGLQLPLREEKAEAPADVAAEDTAVEPLAEVPAQEQPQGRPQCDITISTGDINFELLSCKGDIQRKRINITARVTNLLDNKRWWRQFLMAFDQDGNQMKKCKVTENSNSVTEDFPSGLSTNKVFMLDGVDSSITSLSYVKLSIGDTDIEIKNLPVTW